ncbi:U3 small nucleolar RNA-associated protein 14 B isoform 3 [Hibiscus syriacus]|uniref:U3 small nucleolar RNA-associated protein 14 B isoform 3 n=1 Tax=Hibiscus syriacus TaxID=106335 RepID=A0A6A2XN96_HIBSY|nr:U3 small nucleolar RNA-associated protein 14 B isoform 3 [Hibiscus syriacus]
MVALTVVLCGTIFVLCNHLKYGTFFLYNLLRLGLLISILVHVIASNCRCCHRQLIAVLVPIVGVGAFLWWAGRDIVQSSCPNCGNDFQIFMSFLNDELQLCPYCSQPFSVVDEKFDKEPVKFSNEASNAKQAFNGFSPGFKKGNVSSGPVVDIEAEVKDAD